MSNFVFVFVFLDLKLKAYLVFYFLSILEFVFYYKPTKYKRLIAKKNKAEKNNKREKNAPNIIYIIHRY